MRQKVQSDSIRIKDGGWNLIGDSGIRGGTCIMIGQSDIFLDTSVQMVTL